MMAGFRGEGPSMMRIPLTALFLVLTLPAGRSQVIATHPFDTEMSRAVALEAGATATDVPHHVHYNLKLYDHKGKLTTGTWDIWRDPRHYLRVDIVAGDFHYTHIEDLTLHKQWRHFNTVMPLKVYDLRQAYREPAYVVARFSKADPEHNVRFQQVDGSPFDCTGEISGMRICFDPLAHVLAFAQMSNQTFTWEDWQPLGAHAVPRRYRIYDAGRVMAEADGTAEEVKMFPAGLFVIPPDEPDMGVPEEDGAVPHKLVRLKPVHLDLLYGVYGNVLVQVHVGVDGKVKKTTLIDADDDDIIPEAKQFAHRLIFEPQITNGVPTPFDQYIYVACAAGVQQKSPVGDQ
jgi:hypothetical protein